MVATIAEYNSIQRVTGTVRIAFVNKACEIDDLYSCWSSRNNIDKIVARFSWQEWSKRISLFIALLPIH